MVRSRKTSGRNSPSGTAPVSRKTTIFSLSSRTARPARHRHLRQADEHRAAPRRSHPVLQPGCPADAVPLNVDLDIVLSALAHTICAVLRRLPGYGTATPDTLHRRFLNTGGIIEHHPGQTPGPQDSDGGLTVSR